MLPKAIISETSPSSETSRRGSGGRRLPGTRPGRSPSQTEVPKGYQNRCTWRIVQGKLANIRNHSETIFVVHPVDSNDVAAAEVGADESDQHIGGIVDECNIDGAAKWDEPLGQAAGECSNVPCVRIDP
jgi:hypothetical protein